MRFPNHLISVLVLLLSQSQTWAQKAKSTKAITASNPTAVLLQTALPMYGLMKQTSGARYSTPNEFELRPVEATEGIYPAVKSALNAMGREDLSSAFSSAKVIKKGIEPPALGIYRLYSHNMFVENAEWQRFPYYVLQGSGKFLKFFDSKALGSDPSVMAVASNWADVEVSGDAWKLAGAKEVVTLTPRATEFTPVDFKAYGFTGASMVKTNRPFTGLHYLPYSVDGVLALVTDGKNQYRALFKFPMWQGVYQLRGAKFGGKIILRSAGEEENLYGRFDMDPMNERRGWQSGLLHIKTKSYLRICLTGNSVEISLMANNESTGPGFDWFKDLHDESKISLEVAREKLVEFPTLSDSLKNHFERKTWLLSDDDESFLNEADAAFVQAKMVLSVPPFFHENRQLDTMENQMAANVQQSIMRRVKKMNCLTKPLQISRQ